MADPTPAQLAKARAIVTGLRPVYLRDRYIAAIAAALADEAQQANARIENAKFDARLAEGERIANRVFNELPLDANVSDGNESADPADHIVPCMRAALADAERRGRQAGLREAAPMLRELRNDANRLCDRNLGGTYEEDCRRSIVRADHWLRQLAEEGPSR